jgi:hypothetical protein
MQAIEEAVIEFDAKDAREAYLAYKQAARDGRLGPKRQAQEDSDIARAYREAAKGARIVRLSHVLALGGAQVIETQQQRYVDRQWQSGAFPVRVPNLAVCRADSAYVWTHGIAPDGSWRLQFRRELSQRNTRERMAFPQGTFGESTEQLDNQSWWRPPRLNALVPPVPPALRPRASHLRNFHVLWEVDQWQIAPGPPPGDPALLKHMGGDLYAVVAVWDLTEVERAVLHGRRPGEED